MSAGKIYHFWPECGAWVRTGRGEVWGGFRECGWVRQGITPLKHRAVMSAVECGSSNLQIPKKGPWVRDFSGKLQIWRKKSLTAFWRFVSSRLSSSDRCLCCCPRVLSQWLLRRPKRQRRSAAAVAWSIPTRKDVYMDETLSAAIARMWTRRYGVILAPPQTCKSSPKRRVRSSLRRLMPPNVLTGSLLGKPSGRLCWSAWRRREKNQISTN